MRIKQHPALCESKIIVFNSDIYHDMEMNETETQELSLDQERGLASLCKQLSLDQERGLAPMWPENADENQAVSG